MSDKLAQQLSGPISNSIMAATEAEFAKTDIEIDYMRDLTIDSASGEILDQLGTWAGIPWPVAPSGTFDNNVFAFGAVASYPTTSIRGFNAGLLYSISPPTLVQYPEPMYRTILKAYCKIRSFGLTVTNAEELVRIFSVNYTLSYTADKDLKFTFSPSLDSASIIMLQRLIDIMAVSPQIVLA